MTSFLLLSSLFSIEVKVAFVAIILGMKGKIYRIVKIQNHILNDVQLKTRSL